MKIFLLSLVSIIVFCSYLQSQDKYYSLTSEEIKVLEGKVRQVPDSLRKQFDVLFEAWKDDWQNNPATRISSSTMDATKLKEYDRLMKLGDNILPLVVNKLRDKQNFIGVVLYNSLQKDPSLRIEQGTEQGKAESILRMWVK